MVQVTFKDASNPRCTVECMNNETVRTAFEKADREYRPHRFSIEGCTLEDDMLDMTFSDLDFGDRIMISSTPKADNA